VSLLGLAKRLGRHFRAVKMELEADGIKPLRTGIESCGRFTLDHANGGVAPGGPKSYSSGRSPISRGRC
jgi:hypothetical protein